MPRLSQAQDLARRRINDLAASGLPPEPLSDRLMAALGAAVPNDGYRLFGLDSRTLLVNRLLSASAGDGAARLEWLREVYLAAGPIDYVELPTVMRAGLPAVAFQDRQEISWGYPPEILGRLTPKEHEQHFHELRSPVGGTILAGFTARGRWLAALQTYRRDPGRPFRAGDVAFFRLVSPTIGTALAASLAREAALANESRSRDSRGVEEYESTFSTSRLLDSSTRSVPAVPPSRRPAVSGIVLLEPDARMRFATPAGEEWLGLLKDAGRSAHAPLPTAVWSALAELRSGPPEQAAGVVLAVTEAGPLRIEATSAGPDGSIAIVLAPSLPPAPPEIPPDWPLTRQEAAVVEHLLRGAGNRQIAEALSIGEHTVEWHLRHAYDKLGVHSRTELLARFFQELYLPNLGVESEPLSS